jgi:hypothetical protein
LKLTYCKLIGYVAVCATAFATAPDLASAQSPAAADTSLNPDSSRAVRWLSQPKLSALGFTWLPRIHYSDETGVGLGGTILRPFHWGGGAPGGPNSEMRLKGRVTYRGQWAAEFRLRLGWSDRKWSLNTKLSAETIPGRFYGIGPNAPMENKEVYEPLRTLGYVELLRRVAPGTRLGVRAEIEHFELRKTASGGLLESGLVPGAESGYIAGGGLVWDYDSRDRKYSPGSGSFHQAFAMKFDETTGSGYHFDVYNLDLRRYTSIAPGHVVGLQAFAYMTRGAPPFWRYAAVGGRAHSRGYRKGRYVDLAMVAYQAEYRFDLWRRLGAVVFVGIADVGRRIEDLDHLRMKPTVGMGTRFRLGGRDGVKAQIDVGVSPEDVRLYMSLDEAF